MARILISGSATDYSPWNQDKARQLIQEISRGLIKAGFGIVSGFGEGVGPYVVNGILEQLEREGTQLVDDRIVLRPSPIGITDAVERRRRWRAYRQDMLTHAGVALFIFGNKKNAAGNIVHADGVEEEFSLAVAVAGNCSSWVYWQHSGRTGQAGLGQFYITFRQKVRRFIDAFGRRVSASKGNVRQVAAWSLRC